MKVVKKKIADLAKCYSIAPLKYNGRNCFLVAAEKQDRCYLFSEEGERMAMELKGLGGVMTMQQVPGSGGQFLATRKFYSPNDSKEAEIVVVTPEEGNRWNVRTLCRIPFVHRFGILSRGGADYLIVCCLKSGHEYKDDWRFPGATYTAMLPEDLSGYDAGHPLELMLLKDNMLKNHGYSKYEENGVETAIIGCESGVYQFMPPAVIGGKWEIRQLTEDPCSDAVLIDFDGDGKAELGSISPFHGDTLQFYRQNAKGDYSKEFTYKGKFEMLHATCACEILGKPAWVVGYRKGDRESLLITWENGTYKLEPFDSQTGAANAYMLENGALVVTNREIDEVAMYRFG